MTFVGECEICKQPVDRTHRAAYPVTGWEVARSKGGTNHVIDRRRVPDRVAHWHCLEAKLNGRQLELR